MSQSLYQPLVAVIFMLSTGRGNVSAADRTLVHEAVIEAPLAEVWRLSTTNEGTRQWMAPKVQVDLRVGGEYRASYHHESNLDDEHTIVNRILTYAPMRMLAIQNVQAPAGFAHADFFQQTWTVMHFEPLDEERTRLRMVGLGYGEGPEWDVIYGHFERGNSYLLGLLNDAAKARQPCKQPDAPADDGEEAAPAHVLPPIETEVVVEASLEDVWRAWTTSEGVKGFLGVESNIDLRIGGPYEFHFAPDAPEGQRGSEDCRILAYEPHRMLSFSWNAPPHLPFARRNHAWVVIDFDEVEGEGVHVRLAHYGLDGLRAAHAEHADEFVQTHRYFRQAWPSVLTALKRALEME